MGKANPRLLAGRVTNRQFGPGKRCSKEFQLLHVENSTGLLEVNLLSRFFRDFLNLVLRFLKEVLLIQSSKKFYKYL